MGEDVGTNINIRTGKQNKQPTLERVRNYTTPNLKTRDANTKILNKLWESLIEIENFFIDVLGLYLC